MLSIMDDGWTRAHVTSDFDTLRGLYPDDVAWLATGFEEPGERACLELGPVLIAAEHSIAPGSGFPAHPHRLIDTITICLAGSYRHETGDGNSIIVSAGDVAVVSCGRGVSHCETTQPGEQLKTIMFWVRSNAPDREPRVECARFAERRNRLVPVASGRGAPGALVSCSDVDVLTGTLDTGVIVEHDLGFAAGYLLATGAVEIDGAILEPGARLFVAGELSVLALEPADVVLVVT